MKHLNYHRRFLTQKWTATGTDVRVGTNGRHIADTGPHHTPLDEYPHGLLREDEAHARFIAAAPSIYAAALAVIAASNQSDESLMEEALGTLDLALAEAAK